MPLHDLYDEMRLFLDRLLIRILKNHVQRTHYVEPWVGERTEAVELSA